MEQMEFENLIDKLKKRKEEGDIKNAIKVAEYFAFLLYNKEKIKEL